jgi:hypothetical protein
MRTLCALLGCLLLVSGPLQAADAPILLTIEQTATHYRFVSDLGDTNLLCLARVLWATNLTDWTYLRTNNGLVSRLEFTRPLKETNRFFRVEWQIPPDFAVYPVAAPSVPAGQALRLEVQPDSEGDWLYAWHRVRPGNTGAPELLGSGPVLDLGSATLAMSGQYRCVIGNRIGGQLSWRNGPFFQVTVVP